MELIIYYHSTQFNELIKVYNTDIFRKKSPKSLCLRQSLGKRGSLIDKFKISLIRY